MRFKYTRSRVVKKKAKIRLDAELKGQTYPSLAIYNLGLDERFLIFYPRPTASHPEPIAMCALRATLVHIDGLRGYFDDNTCELVITDILVSAGTEADPRDIDDIKESINHVLRMGDVNIIVSF